MQLALKTARKGVHPLRAIEGDCGDLFLDAVDQVLVAHVVLAAGLLNCRCQTAALKAPSIAISTATTPCPTGLTMTGLRSSVRNLPALATAKSPRRTRKVASASISPGWRPRAPHKIGSALIRRIKRSASLYDRGAISVVVFLKN